MVHIQDNSSAPTTAGARILMHTIHRLIVLRQLKKMKTFNLILYTEINSYGDIPERKLLIIKIT